MEQYHRALSIQPSLSICGDMLSQLLEDMRLYRPGTKKTLSPFSPLPISSIEKDKPNFIDSLIHPSILKNENENHFDDSINLNLSQSLQFSPDQQNESMNISSRIYNDHGGSGDGNDGNDDDDLNVAFPSNNSRIRKLSQDISYLSQVSSTSPPISSQQYDVDDEEGSNDQDHIFYDEDSNSVESYSRIAGRLSLDSSSQMSG